MVVIFLGTQNVIKYLQNISADWFLEPILLSLVQDIISLWPFWDCQYRLKSTKFPSMKD